MTPVRWRARKRAPAQMALGVTLTLLVGGSWLQAQSTAAQAGAQVRRAALAVSTRRPSTEANHQAATAQGSRKAAKQIAEVRRPSSSVLRVGLRDPFKGFPPAPPPRTSAELAAMEEAMEEAMEARLPPGPGGLIISQLRLEGIVREEESQTMIAVVTNRTNLAYFLTDNERLYDGSITRITADAVYLKENVRDPDGGVASREVVLRLGSLPGVEK